MSVSWARDAGLALAELAAFRQGERSATAIADRVDAAVDALDARSWVMPPWAELAGLPAVQPARESVLAARTEAELARVWAGPVDGDAYRPFYCLRADCDGKPHGGWSWPHARADQVPPRDSWSTLFWLSGRGAGKTLGSSNWVAALCRNPSARVAVVGPTADSVRKVQVEGPAGLLAVAHPDNVPTYEPTLRQLAYPSGALAFTYSAEEPERLRGPEHTAAAADEMCYYPKVERLWSNLRFGLRRGLSPRLLITSTPKPSKWLRKVLAEPGTIRRTVSTRVNLANLAPEYAEQILAEFEGTRLGRQEIDGEVLEGAEGALWSMEEIDAARLSGSVIPRRDPGSPFPAFFRYCIGVDPAGTGSATSDETGLVVVGETRDNRDQPVACIVLDESGRYHAAGWAPRVVELALQLQATGVPVSVHLEVSGSAGDALVKLVKNEPGSGAVPLRRVTARGSKQDRAAILHQHMRRHRAWVVDHLPGLEDQMISWVPGESPSCDRIDAAGYAVEAVLVPRSTMSTATGGTVRI